MTKGLAERLGLRFSWKAAAVGIPLSIIYLLLYLVAATLLVMVWPEARAFRNTWSAPFWLLLLFVVAKAFVVETVATAAVIAALERHGAAVAIGASTLLRVVLHVYEGPLGAIGVIPVGLVFGTMFWRQRNVWPLIVAHAIAGAVAVGMR